MLDAMSAGLCALLMAIQASHALTKMCGMAHLSGLAESHHHLDRRMVPSLSTDVGAGREFVC